MCKSTEKRLQKLESLPNISKNHTTSIKKSLKDLEFIHKWLANSKDTDQRDYIRIDDDEDRMFIEQNFLAM